MTTLSYVKSKSAKRLEGLHPSVRLATERLIEQSYAAGVPIVITQGLRTIAEQDALFAKGRDANGKIIKPKDVVTNARGGRSYHNYGLAVDYALLMPDGATVTWDTARDGDKDGQRDWFEVAAIGKALGFEWGGDWDHFVDMPHFQMTFGLTLDDCQRGKQPHEVKEEENQLDKVKTTINGKAAADALVYEGSTYIKVSELAKLGVPFYWDNSNKTVVLGK
ncbi:M15 family metallopeptidase [Paenibacillus aurantiacus]|uniref:M15 family metallopeptidase n=1 Tax=Paenibacillus aurantiacus TaxID=1936118 RepID=A0ABV5KRI3_9BACL